MSNGGTHQFRHLSVESLFLKKKAYRGRVEGTPGSPPSSYASVFE